MKNNMKSTCTTLADWLNALGVVLAIVIALIAVVEVAKLLLGQPAVFIGG